MDGYLLDTSVLSALIDSTHQQHDAATDWQAQIPDGCPRYVSVIAIGELAYGKELAEAVKKVPLPGLAAILEEARKYQLLGVNKHTASEYAWIKAQLALKYIPNPLGRERRRWVENWIDAATGQALQVDENDLWMHAQARERGLIIVTADKKQEKITSAIGSTWMLVGESP